MAEQIKTTVDATHTPAGEFYSNRSCIYRGVPIHEKSYYIDNLNWGIRYVIEKGDYNTEGIIFNPLSIYRDHHFKTVTEALDFIDQGYD